jgi:HEAT repeat protein
MRLSTGALMSVARLLLAVIAPLGLTLWVLVFTTVVVVVLLALVIGRGLDSARADRRREHVRAELEPVFASFFDTADSARFVEELRPIMLRMDAAHRPVAAVLMIDLMQHVSTPSQTEELRRAFDDVGLIDLAERGTRRWSPWRRALACELLGKIGARRSVPALLARLDDRRPEVRSAAVSALGQIGSADALPALSEAFLERRGAPTNVVNNALRRIGGESVTTFERGVSSADPVVRVSSCFGLSEAEERGAATLRLADVLASDADARVRTAAAAALGIVGGDDAPAALLDATTDPEVQIRRSAVKALGSFDDPTSAVVLDKHTDDDDRETALRAAEALLALTQRSRAAPEARARLESSPVWAVEYVRKIAEVRA